MQQLHQIHPLTGDLRQGLGWRDQLGLGRQVQHAATAVASPEQLLAPDRLFDLMLRRPLEPPRLRCFQNGEELHPNTYLQRVTTRRRTSQCLVNPVLMSQHLDDGVTVVLDAVDAMDPTVEVACRALQWWLGERVQANAYLTTGSSAGFPVHWDDHDVIVVQVAGSKEWDIRGPTRPAPMHRDSELSQEPSDEVVWKGTVEAGDVLHIPRGYWHSAWRSDDAYSLHLSFGVTQRTGADWLAQVADLARGQLRFRRDLTESADSVEELRQGAIELIQQSEPETYLSSRRALAEPAPFLHSHRVSPTPDALVCVTQFPPQITAFAADGTFHVTGGGQQLTFRPAAREVVGTCLTGLPAPLAPLTDRFGEDIVSSVTTALLEARICAPTSADSLLASTAPA